jgi:hypothetical protein
VRVGNCGDSVAPYLRCLIRPPTAAAARHVELNNDLVRSDFVHDQVAADRKPSEFGIACRYPQMRLLGDQPCHLFDTCDELGCCARVVFRNVCKNIVKVGERTAFEPELHALR